MPDFICNECGKALANADSLRVHKRTHSSERRFQCEICKKGFSRSDLLTEHMRTHTGEKPFQCDVCSRAFAAKGNLAQHMLVHTGEKAFQCDVCSRAFAVKGNLAKHMLVHSGERSHKCLPCGVSFAALGNFKRHNESVHNENTPFQCQICGCRFSRQFYLFRHFEVGHPSESATQSTTVHTHTEPEGMVTVTTQTRVSSNNTTTISTVTSPVGSAYIVTKRSPSATITMATQGSSGLVTTYTDQNFPGSDSGRIFVDESDPELLGVYLPSGSQPVNRARPSGTPDVTNVQTSPGGKRVDIPNVRKRVCLGGSAPSEPPKKIKVEVIDADSWSESRVARPGPSSSFTDSDVSGSCAGKLTSKDHLQEISKSLGINVDFFSNLFSKGNITACHDFKRLAKLIIRKLGSVSGEIPKETARDQKSLLIKEMARLVGIEVIHEGKKYFLSSPESCKNVVSETKIFESVKNALDKLIKDKEVETDDVDLSLSSHSSDKEPHLDSSDEVVLVKSELKTDVLSRQHRFDNRAPIWHAEPSVKKEIDETPRKKRSKMDFDSIGVPKNKKIRNEINAAIDQYKKLNVDDRESYLNARMRINKNDGSVFPGLKGQNEVIAAKNIQQWEILGHYAGERLSDNTYVQGARAVGASLRKIDSYSYGLSSRSSNEFISGFRQGNITTCINSCTTYDGTDRCLPEKNVSFIDHYHKEDNVTIPFVIALKPIKAGDVIWIDYGKEYWDIMNSPIEVDSD